VACSVKSTKQPRSDLEIQVEDQIQIHFKFFGYVNNIFFAVKSVVKKLLSIEIVIFHTLICTFGGIMGKISVTGSCLEQP
jgi:hypothetical protein